MDTMVRYEVGEGYSAVDADVEQLLVDLPSSPVDNCRVVQGLVVLSNLAEGFGIDAFLSRPTPAAYPWRERSPSPIM